MNAQTLTAATKNFRCSRITAVALSSMLTFPAAAQTVGQSFKLLPNDGASGNEFGDAVGVDGTTAIVGASQRDQDNGVDSGAAYLFDTLTGSQLLKLLPSDGAPEDRFGVSVAISGTTAAVGAFLDDDNGVNSGSVYLFDTGSGVQVAKLLPSDGATQDFFGTSIAISGDTIVIGANFDDDNGGASGSAYLFDTTTGLQTVKFLADDGAPGDEFGFSVAISGTTAIIGAFRDDDNGTDSGSAYLFDTTTGQQIAKLLPDDGAQGDSFGVSVAISGTTAVVGAYFDDDNGSSSGSAYLFDTTTGMQIAKLLPDDGAEFDFFGRSVGISGTTAVVGSLDDDDNGNGSGSAYLFDTTTGQQMAKLLPSDGAAGDSLGRAVAISGTTIVAGAPDDDDNGSFSGSAYLFSAAPCPADLTEDGDLDFFDVSTFLQWFSDHDPRADWNDDGVFDFFDVQQYLSDFSAGCP